MDGTKTPAHVVLNALLLNLSATYRSAGISQYEQHVLEALGHIQANSPFRLTAITGEHQWHPPAGIRVYTPQWPVHHPLARILWEQGRLGRVLKRMNAQLYHGLAFVAPLHTPVPTVVTVHDLSFVHHADTFPAWKALYLKWFTRASIRRARRVIAVSESTRQDVIQWLSLPPHRVVTVYNGVSSRFRPLPKPQVEAWRREKGLPAQFILYLGTLQPRKNIATLVRAYAQWRQAHPHASIPLILAGAKGWYYQDLFRLVETLGVREDVLFPGFVPSSELPYWYNAATLFAYPSLFEGFGLPVLEAMACGTPVIAANTTSLPELVGSAGLLIPPTDTHQWQRALERVLGDPSLRDHLVQQGLERARAFTWERTARETLAVYHRVLEEHHA